MNIPKYDQVKLKLVGEDSNAFSILGRARNQALKSGVSKEEVAVFLAEATSGDYDHLLRTCIEWFDCDSSDEDEDEDEDEEED